MRLPFLTQHILHLLRPRVVATALLVVLVVCAEVYAGYKMWNYYAELGGIVPGTATASEEVSLGVVGEGISTIAPINSPSSSKNVLTPVDSPPGDKPPSAPDITSSYCRTFTPIGSAAQVVSPAQKSAVDIEGWTDMSLGVLKKGDIYHFYGVDHSISSRGGTIERPQHQILTTGTLDNPLARSIQGMPEIETPARNFKYLGGGPVYYDNNSRLLFQVLHLERYYGDTRTDDIWSEIRLGIINQETLATKDLGRIIYPNLSYEQGKTAYLSGKKASALVGAPNIVSPGDGYLYIYYQDYYLDPVTGNAKPRFMSVARAKTSDVVSAAQRGTVSVWQKYYNGAWSTSGIGGQTTSLTEQTNVSPAVARSTTFGGLVAVSGSQATKFYMASSANGINWNAQQKVVDVDSSQYWVAYPSLVGMGSDPSDLGTDFYVFYLRWGMKDGKRNWGDASIMRQQIRCTERG